MAWTAPLTAVANETFFAADFNTSVRDNLLETAPAKATSEGQYFITDSANSITPYIGAVGADDAGGNRSSTVYGDADEGAGPSVTLTTGTRAYVSVFCQQGNTVSSTGGSFVSFDVSGSTTLAARDEWAVGEEEYSSTNGRIIGSRMTFVEGLTPGSNTFTMKYRTGSSGTILASARKISVLSF